MLGAKLGGYVIERKLAEGGMGEVYVARHELMHRDAVVKVLHRELSVNDEMVRRFFNEARAAASIHHPGIVEIYDMGHAGGQAYIVMEMLRGEVLSARIARGRMRALQAVNVVRQLAGALGAAHERGIIHRDLKPDNIFLVPDPEVPGGERVKVLDFGIAKLASRRGSIMTVAGSVFGTPAYMAPEQCSDSAAVDHRADLYALGCILFELLCGRPPFGHGGIELMAAQLRDQPPPPRSLEPSIPAAVEQVVLRLLAKDPADRFQSCAELVAALEGSSRQMSAQLAAAHAETVAPERAPTPAPVRAPTPTPIPAASSGHHPITTQGGAAGQVAPPEPAAAGSRAGMFAAIAAVVVVLGGGGAYLLLQGGGTTDASAGAPAEVADAAVAVDPRIEEQHRIARTAIDERRWDDALVAASQLGTLAPDDPRAATLQEIARAEMRNQLVFERLKTAAGAGDAAALAAAWKDLTEDSAYRDLGRVDYERVRDDYVAKRRHEAEKAAKRKRCDDVAELAGEVGALFPEARADLETIAERCRRQRGGSRTTNAEVSTSTGDRKDDDASSSSSSTSSTKCDEVACRVDPDLPCCKNIEKEPPPDDDPAERPTRHDIQQSLGRVRARVNACAAKHQAKGTVAVKIRVAPDGRVASATVSSAPDPALGACVVAAVKMARFRRTKQGISISYPFVIR